MRWQNVYSECFGIAHGVRQGGVLSPYLFKLYIKDFLKSVIGCNIGCNIAGRLVNILAFADDTVLMAPSWRVLQCLLDIIVKAAADIDKTSAATVSGPPSSVNVSSMFGITCLMAL